MNLSHLGILLEHENGLFSHPLASLAWPSLRTHLKARINTALKKPRGGEVSTTFSCNPPILFRWRKKNKRKINGSYKIIR